MNVAYTPARYSLQVSVPQFLELVDLLLLNAQRHMVDVSSLRILKMES